MYTGVHLVDDDVMDIQYFKQRLLDRRDELEDIIEDSKQSKKPVELDQTSVGRVSRGDALQQQAMAVNVHKRRKDEIQRIDTALARIESDDFGYCVACDEEISVERLEMDPSLALCVKCAK